MTWLKNIALFLIPAYVCAPLIYVGLKMDPFMGWWAVGIALGACFLVAKEY